MLNKEEVLTIINKTELSDLECINIIQQHIYDVKGINVKINRPQGLPIILGFANIILDVELMMQMYNNELGDILYDFSYDYGNNTIKPTIV